VTVCGWGQRERSGEVSDDTAAWVTGDRDAGPDETAGADGPVTEPLSLPITALDLGGDAVFVTDPDGIIVDVNDAFVRMTGYARSEAIGESPRLLSSGFQDDAFYEQLWATITGGEVWEGEIIDRRRDGELQTHHVTITPVRDGTGRITNYVAVERDISGDLARAGGSARSGLVHTDATGRCIYADHDAAAMFDVDPSALLGGGLQASMADEDADALVEAVGMAVERGRDFRLEVRSATGRWVQFVIAPLTLASGTVIGARCSLEDITERMDVEHELARRSAMVTSVLDALDEPIAVIDSDGGVLTTNLAWRRAGDRQGEGHAGLLTALRPGADARTAIEQVAAGGDPDAAVLRDDLSELLAGQGLRHRPAGAFSVHPLAWEEGGAILRHRPTTMDARPRGAQP
jgi:PAS domain S-box-containing protein